MLNWTENESQDTMILSRQNYLKVLKYIFSSTPLTESHRWLLLQNQLQLHIFSSQNLNSANNDPNF